MRALILLAGAALALAACGGNGQADQTLNADETLTADDIVANDVTAIDAVTGDAANMAADVAINVANEQVAATGNGSASQPKPRSTQPAARSSTTPQTSNTSQPATQNTTVPAAATANNML
jgi:hypothetical protein